MPTGGRIVLGEDDFDDVPAGQTQAAPPPAALGGTAGTNEQPSSALPPVARRPPMQLAMGSPGKTVPPTAGRRWLYDARTGPLVAAAAGILVAWAITEILGVENAGEHATSKSSLNAASGLWTGSIAALFACVVVGFDRAVEGAWQEVWRRATRTAIPAFVVGFASGYIAQAVYTHMLIAAVKHNDFDVGSGRFYLARIIGWAIFGLGIGVVFGLLDKSQRKAINGALGGVAGGAAGGAIFQWASLNIHSQHTPRLIGLLGVGLLVALAIRTVETARREAWLQIVAGGMAGKEFILYHAVTRLGASPDCEIFLLKDPAIAPLHAQIEDRGHQRILSVAPGATVHINQTPVTSQVLRHGDQIQIGNTVIGYAERATAPAPVAAAA